MVTPTDVLSAIDQEYLSLGKIHAVPFQNIVERTGVGKGTPEFTLLENILEVLVTQGKLKRINGNPPLFLKP